MGEITESRTAMMVAVLAAFTYALGSAFAILAYAVLSTSNLGTFTDLGHASDWLHFAGALGALAGVGIVAPDLVKQQQQQQQQQQPTALWEVAGAAVATFLVAVGALVNAASSSSTSAADIIGAVGIGGWALLVFSRAARPSSATPSGRSGPNAQAALWLGASAGLLLLAVGSGFNVDVTNQSIGVASGVVEALGIGAVTLVLATGRNQGLLRGRPVPIVIGGLGVVALFFLGTAVVAGVVFGPNPSIDGLRVGISLVTTLELIGVAILGFAAWTRVNEIVVPAGIPGATMLPSSPASAAPTVAPVPRACASCGALLPISSNVCEQCGTVNPAT